VESASDTKVSITSKIGEFMDASSKRGRYLTMLANENESKSIDVSVGNKGVLEVPRHAYWHVAPLIILALIECPP